MRIALVSHGELPVPPPDLGSVEILTWEYAQRLRKLGAEVEIVNVPYKKVVGEILRHRRQGKRFDWIWCHNQRAVPYVVAAGRLHGARVAATCHVPMTDLTTPDRFVNARGIRKAARAPYQLMLIEEAGLTFGTLNPRAKLAHLPNGVDTVGFRFDPRPGNGRAVCVGAIASRKRQRELADLATAHGLPFDIVGPTADYIEPEHRVDGYPHYLGAWSRDTMRERLTEYSCLVLWSLSEVQALVVLEAFAAGLSVVVSPESTGNLDLSLPFIRVANSPCEVADGIRDMIDANPGQRAAIRSHAESEWDWDRMAERALRQFEEWSTD